MTLDIIWHPGEEWPDKADDNLTEQAVVQIYKERFIRTAHSPKRKWTQSRLNFTM